MYACVYIVYRYGCNSFVFFLGGAMQYNDVRPEISALQKAVNQLLEKQKKDNAQKQIDVIADMMSTAFDKSMVYSNAIMIAGYAGIFGIWSYVRDKITSNASVCIALFLGISISVFIAFELYKMVMYSISSMKQLSIIKYELPPDVFFEKLQELKRRNNSNSMKFMFILWVVSFFISVFFAIAALVVLFYNLAAILVGWPLWPK